MLKDGFGLKTVQVEKEGEGQTGKCTYQLLYHNVGMNDDREGTKLKEFFMAGGQ